LSKFSDLIQNLKRKLFGTDKRQPESLLVSSPPAESSLSEPTVVVSSDPARRQPYFVQIGFDFGTSYSKCICRDVAIDKAWVYIPNSSVKSELPFLIPGALLLNDGTLEHVEHQGIDYPENGLYHLKHALVKAALQEWDDPVLTVYRNAKGLSDVKELSRFVENCAVYYLAGVLGEIRNDVRRRMPDFGALKKDYMAVNLAVPVADAQLPQVNTAYKRVLYEAWRLADKLAGHPPLHLMDLESLRNSSQNAEGGDGAGACTIYPEVSANVQGFVRSRVSSPGIYLFSDTGAGTVDQSVFIFSRRDHGEHLTYLHGCVLPLGSSQIERRAAASSGRADLQSLEVWREKKEQGGQESELRAARDWITGQLSGGTESTLAHAKRKLFVRDQLNDIRVIFGGGGHCGHPYMIGTMRPFSGQLFRNEIRPDVIGLPIPRDLELKDSEIRWMRRLYVAYGLSFEKSQLTGFTYPADVRDPEPQEIWAPRRQIPDMPEND